MGEAHPTISLGKTLFRLIPETHLFGAGVKKVLGKLFHVTRRAIDKEVNCKKYSRYFFGNIL
ncbi:MAG: hypothetical protein DWP95_06805 [Proteobacteria bacterium]|nr:MAG: hypothetical protein DWP95_06805 [Pseudomonadota bacterium]